MSTVAKAAASGNRHSPVKQIKKKNPPDGHIQPRPEGFFYIFERLRSAFI